MEAPGLDGIFSELKKMQTTRPVGRVCGVYADGIRVSGLSNCARLGDRVMLRRPDAPPIFGEVVRLETDTLMVLPDSPPDGIALGERAILQSELRLYPCRDWIGRVIDPYGQPIDDRRLPRGTQGYRLHSDPPPPVRRMPLGERLDTGLVVLNTLLPMVRGQRVGLFAGSGVGKTSLLGQLAAHMQADVVVIALVGERGREVREFIDKVLGPQGMARSVIVAATSDQSPLMRRQCAFAAMSIAEYFRDQGDNVLYLADSVTRLAEAHREVATAAGEPPALRGHPASMTHLITSLCERAGPGEDGSGYISAVFSVLVAGSDMDEPVADCLRGVLDGHIILDRGIAESGRFPAIDVVRSVSRSLPDAASELENAQIMRARRLISSYTKSETMIRAGLYAEGSDPILDQAVRIWDDLEKLLARREPDGIEASFKALQATLRAADSYARAARQ